MLILQYRLMFSYRVAYLSMSCCVFTRFVVNKKATIVLLFENAIPSISIDFARSVDGSECFNYDINENISSLKYK